MSVFICQFVCFLGLIIIDNPFIPKKLLAGELNCMQTWGDPYCKISGSNILTNNAFTHNL